MSNLTRAHLLAVCPTAKEAVLAAIVDHWDAVLGAYQITNRNECLHLLAHMAVESAHFEALQENMNYNPNGVLLYRTFKKKYFKTPLLAAALAKQGPVAIANYVYGGRYGNRLAGAGWMYRGQGLLQLTFFDNYAAVGKVCSLDLLGHPELVSNPAYSLQVACAYWHLHNVGPAARANDIAKSTRLVQGGSGGLDARKIYLVLLTRALINVDLVPSGHSSVAGPRSAPPLPAARPAPAVLPRSTIPTTASFLPFMAEPEPEQQRTNFMANPPSESALKAMLPNSTVTHDGRPGVIIPVEDVVDLLKKVPTPADATASKAVAALDATAFAKAIVPPDPTSGMKTYIAAGSLVLTMLGGDLLLYSQGQLTTQAVMLSLGGIFTAGAFAGVRQAISAHFGALGNAIMDQIIAMTQAQGTRK